MSSYISALNFPKNKFTQVCQKQILTKKYIIRIFTPDIVCSNRYPGGIECGVQKVNKKINVKNLI